MPNLRCEKECVLCESRHDRRQGAEWVALDKCTIAQVATLQLSTKDISAAAAATKGEYEDKVRTGNEALESAKAELAGRDTKLSSALAEQARLHREEDAWRERAEAAQAVVLDTPSGRYARRLMPFGLKTATSVAVLHKAARPVGSGAWPHRKEQTPKTPNPLF